MMASKFLQRLFLFWLLFASISAEAQVIKAGITAATASQITRDSLASKTIITAKTTSYTLTDADYTIEVTATGQTMTLPSAIGVSGREYTIKLTASGTGTVATTSSQTIDGSSTYSLSAQYKYVKVKSNGVNWLIIGNN
jgi:hypothetical protein